MVADSGQPKRRASDMPGTRIIHRSGNSDFAELVIDDPHIFLESGQVLFAEGDAPACMYVVRTGALQIRSGSVIYEDVGPGGIVGAMGLVVKPQRRTAPVNALAGSETAQSHE